MEYYLSYLGLRSCAIRLASQLPADLAKVIASYDADSRALHGLAELIGQQRIEIRVDDGFLAIEADKECSDHVIMTLRQPAKKMPWVETRLRPSMALMAELLTSPTRLNNILFHMWHDTSYRCHVHSMAVALCHGFDQLANTEFRRLCYIRPDAS